MGADGSVGGEVLSLGVGDLGRISGHIVSWGGYGPWGGVGVWGGVSVHGVWVNGVAGSLSVVGGVVISLGMGNLGGV